MSARYECFQIVFKLADGTRRKYAGIYDSPEQAHSMIANPIREQITESSSYDVIPAIWPDDWRTQ